MGIPTTVMMSLAEGLIDRLAEHKNIKRIIELLEKIEANPRKSEELITEASEQIVVAKKRGRPKVVK